MGALIAQGNKQSPLLGAMQAMMVEGVAHTPYANSLAGGAALAVVYAWMIADLAQLDVALAEAFKSGPVEPISHEQAKPPAYAPHFYAGGRTG